MLEAALTGRLDPEAAARRAAGLIEAITGLPTVGNGGGVKGHDLDGAHYLAGAAATADRVAETTAGTDAVPVAAQTIPPATNIAGKPTTA